MNTTKLASYRIATAWLLVAGVNSVLATDRHVPAEYPTIQAAVNAAASGDTIHIEEGFSVEAAPTPNGLWSTLDAAPVRQSGQNSVVVPADSEQQFFRLKKP